MIKTWKCDTERPRVQPGTWTSKTKKLEHITPVLKSCVSFSENCKNAETLSSEFKFKTVFF